MRLAELTRDALRDHPARANAGVKGVVLREDAPYKDAQGVVRTPFWSVEWGANAEFNPVMRIQYVTVTAYIQPSAPRRVLYAATKAARETLEGMEIRDGRDHITFWVTPAETGDFPDDGMGLIGRSVTAIGDQ